MKSSKEPGHSWIFIHALKAFRGKIDWTAIHANIPKKTLLRKLEKYGISARDFGGCGRIFGMNHVETRLDSAGPSYWKWIWALIGTALFCLFAHRAWFIPDSDYVAYYNAGLRALKGENPYLYEATPFKYLPVVSWVFAPFALLPYTVSRMLFFALSFGTGLWAYSRVHQKLGNWVALGLLA